MIFEASIRRITSAPMEIGAISGKVTCQNVRQGPAPSMAAAVAIFAVALAVAWAWKSRYAVPAVLAAAAVVGWSVMR